MLEDIERQEDDNGDDGIDALDDIDFVEQDIEMDDHKSDSELDLDSDGDDSGSIAEEDFDGLRFYIGKDGETIWSNKTVALAPKTKSKNIIKTIAGLKGQACKCKPHLECFQQMITLKLLMIL